MNQIVAHESARLARRIAFLDYMRIFAFLSVLIGHKLFDTLSHIAENQSLHITLRLMAKLLMQLCYGGGAGVVVFFLTSGYIITHVLRYETTAEFLVKRIFRIYPLFVAAVVLETVFAYSVNGVPFPTLATWIPRLLLIGDFFGTPYALAGVEWTLRIEVVFYVFMATLSSAGALNRPAILPALFVLVTAVLGMLGPFPDFAGWSNGYLTIYGPYLLIGSTIYLIEHQLTNRWNGASAIAIIFITSLLFSGELQPSWNGAHFASLALALFIGAWFTRAKLYGGPLVRLLSELTFAVYLFHNWLWSYIDNELKALNIRILPQEAQIIIILFIVCYIAQRAIERPGVALGRIAVNFLKGKRGRQNTSSVASATPP